MAFSISNLFTSNNSTPAEPAPAPAATPAQPGNLPDKPPVDPTKVEGKNNPDPSTPNSPLDQFSTLWETDPNKEGDVPPAQLDPAKVQEAMQKADFSNLITQENLAAITAGGEGAAKAFIESLNAVARQSLTQSTLITNKMIEQAVAKAQAEQQAKLPELLKKQNLSETLSDSNPIFKNPAVKPVIEALQTQLAVKYPNASTKELADMANKYVIAMGESFVPKQQKDTTKGNEDVDWSIFFDA